MAIGNGLELLGLGTDLEVEVVYIQDEQPTNLYARIIYSLQETQVKHMLPSHRLPWQLWHSCTIHINWPVMAQMPLARNSFPQIALQRLNRYLTCAIGLTAEATLCRKGAALLLSS
jgi:hypothetical protein